MRSVTSYFNPTLYRKTMGRFWPMWALYGLGWMFLMPLNMLNEYFDRYRSSDPVTRLLDMAKDLPGILRPGVDLACVGGVLCAMAVFSYLYNNRAASMLHALPMKRETLFTTQYLAGLSFMLLPHLAVAGLTAAVEIVLLPSMYWGTALSALGLWLVVQSGICLFFFSFAAFCAMFTGHILALPAFYSVLNALVVTLNYLITELVSNFLYGLPRGGAGGDLVAWCTPVLQLFQACNWAPQWTDGMPSAQYYLESPGTVAAYAAAGLVFAVLALMVYRRRHVESAGDVVSIAIVRPIFTYGVALCSGLCLGTLTAVFFNWSADALPLTVCALLWTAVGYFAAKMLLKKSFRVFRAWKGCLAAVAVMALLCAACCLDLFGVENRFPDVEDVASVDVYSSIGGYPYDSGRFALHDCTDPAAIQRLADLHRAVVAEKDRRDGGDDYFTLDLTYTMKDGSTLRRYYSSVPILRDEVELEGSVTWQADQLRRDRDLVERSYDFDTCEKGRLVEAYLNPVYCRDPQEDRTRYITDPTELWAAMRRDFDEGTIGVRYLFDDEERAENTCRTDLVFNWEMPSQSTDRPAGRPALRTLAITMTPNAKNTLAVLEELGVLDEDHTLAPHSWSEEEVIPPAAEDGPGSEVVEVS